MAGCLLFDAIRRKDNRLPCGREIAVRKSVSIVIEHRTKHDVQMMVDVLQRYVSYIRQHVIPNDCWQCDIETRDHSLKTTTQLV